ncbi:MAG: 2-dehydro-3-deoxygluconokinase [Phycisphaerae bacterium]|nr:2-dehydro-3-deoxygluconokinase [Phycisphaerae bacterium]
MMRLSTPGFQRFRQARSFDINFGGGEGNVAVSIANFGGDARFVTKLPTHEIGQACIDFLRGRGVDTSCVVRGGDRIGTYFLETGASQRSSKVIYDRANAAVTTLTADELAKQAGGDLSNVFEGAGWFHWTGITPALGDRSRDTLVALLKAAKAAGCVVSADLNYRKKLWTVDEARRAMTPLMEHVDVCIANEEDADKSLGMAATHTDVEAGQIDEAGYADLAGKLKERFGFKAVAITLRESFSASRNGWSAMLLDEAQCSTPTRSRVYDVQLVDRVGGGDSFAAGLIHGLTTLDDSREALEFAVAASAFKQTIPGDVNEASEAEVLAIARGGGSGRVER